MKPLGIYIHIPFCRSKCAYCDFYSLAGEREGQMDAYLATLKEDIKGWSNRLRDYQIDTLYIGGGTPSWFGGRRVGELIEWVKGCCALSPDCEITVEANPDSLTKTDLELLTAKGLTRLSMGVQSACESELKAIGRPHSFLQAAEKVEMARRVGVKSLSLDLIYGLPGQTLEGWQSSVEEVLALKPDHLSLYGLKVEEGTPLWKNRECYDLPDDDFQADCYLWAAERLEREGFVHYEISNFARPGHESRHNLKYWTLGEYLGFGPAAHSDFGGIRFGNSRDLGGYLIGNCCRSEETVISPDERREEYIMLGLRTRWGISGEEYEGIHGESFAPMERKLRDFSKHGLCLKEEGRWRLTAKGWLLSNAIITELLA